MKSLYRSNATVDTHPTTSTVAHNCPSCRCRSSDLSLNLKHSVSQPYLSHRQQQPNLYLSNHLSEAASEPVHGFRSAIFHQPAQKITFKYAAAVSPKQANISFSYTSPPKNRKPHSSDAKFSTRKFKNLHFPQISQEDDTVPVKKIVKGGKEEREGVHSPYYEVFSGEKTPEKHRVLKMKKQRPKQKLQITVSKKSSNSIEQDDLPHCQNPQNDYQFDVPRNTPINALWMANSERTQKSLRQEDMQRFLARDLVPASIEHIQHAQPTSRREILPRNTLSPQGSLQQLPAFPLPAQPMPAKEGSSRRKYPTIESLDGYEGKAYVESVSEQVRGALSVQQTSLRFLRESEKESSGASEVDLARSISEELSLHYDYYYPQEESDPSLSLHVAI